MNKSITIITDASFCPVTKAAGYGIWIAAAAHGRKAFEGPLDKPADNNVAEAMAIGNALWHGFNSGLLSADCNILIQSDSESAIRAASGEYTGNNKQLHNVANYVRKLQQEYRLTLRYKHVPGHTKGADNRTRAQIKCDEAAGRQMQLQRSQILQDNPELMAPVPSKRRSSVNYLRSRRRNNHG